MVVYVFKVALFKQLFFKIQMVQYVFNDLIKGRLNDLRVLIARQAANHIGRINQPSVLMVQIGISDGHIVAPDYCPCHFLFLCPTWHNAKCIE
uniref:ATPase involved in DNA replication initiation n=1 Tax=Magnetospirillum gryphiswaldense TaxID=55518 RepID=A4U441_9PROT|nr:ATPase involved in DNA replication initiation [Magnetospirillum gryphiswaldense MSR-1]